MSLDWLIRGGTVVDGTGAPAHRADVGIRGGRVVALGEISETAERTVDAEGCIVAPGFIDPHTHLDAQLCWDGAASPTCLHGVTSVVIGLCGFGVAPCATGGGDYLLRSLERVEEIPFDSTSLAVPFEWSGWAEFFEWIGRRPLGVHVAGFVPHSPLRCYAMGDRARGEVANSDDREAMCDELSRALAAGALGFATSRGPNHEDAFGEPVPSRFADDAELEALVGMCRGRVWQINVETKFGRDAGALTGEVERYAAWTERADARLSWTPFHAEPGYGVWQAVLEHNRELNRRGIAVSPQVAPQPVTVVLRFDHPSYASAIRGWSEAMQDFFARDAAGRLELLAESGFRTALRSAPEKPATIFAPWYPDWLVAHSASQPDTTGRSLADLAEERGTHPVDALCDLLIADELDTSIQVPVANRDGDGAAQLVADPNTLIGLGDSGAHVTSVSNYSYPTYVLSELVRDRGVLPVEAAVHALTGHPAAFLGIPGRGIVQVGAAADLVVVDLDRLALGRPSLRRDLPGGSPRLFQGARGYRAVFVDGGLSVSDDEPTGLANGGLLRAVSQSAGGTA